MPARFIKSPLGRFLMIPVAIFVGFCLVFAGFLLFVQRWLVYPGLTLIDHSQQVDASPAVAIEFETSQGRQIAYYLPPGDGGAMPSPLWVCFHGNASTATDWLDFLHGYPDGRAGFLLLDYPGFMGSEGRPSPRNMRESATYGVAALANHLGSDVATLQGDMAVLGFSLGGGGALDFASRHPVHTVVVSSTFTSLTDMAKRTVPWPFYHLLLFRYDNTERLKELMARANPPRVVVFHGTNDEVIPVSHGRRLAELFPTANYHEVTGADHNFILFGAQPRLWEAMRGGSQ